MNWKWKETTNSDMIYLDKELKRLYAIQSSNKLRDIESIKISKEKNLNAIQSESKKLDEQRRPTPG